MKYQKCIHFLNFSLSYCGGFVWYGIEKQANHAFRKRFDTILKSNQNINISLAEKMMGHSITIPLDNVYFKPAIEQMFDEYQKAIPELTIDDKYWFELQLKEKDEKINELNKKDNEIDSLKNTILRLKITC